DPDFHWARADLQRSLCLKEVERNSQREVDRAACRRRAAEEPIIGRNLGLQSPWAERHRRHDSTSERSRIEPSAVTLKSSPSPSLQPYPRLPFALLLGTGAMFALSARLL